MSEIVVVSVGNSRVKFAKATGLEVDESSAVGNDDVAGAIEGIRRLAEGGRPVVIATVNGPVADKIGAGLDVPEVYRVGRDLEIPIRHALDDASTVGQDRLLNAMGAFARAKQACIVVDAGTALTVDFVDGEGTFHGGVIAPGVNMSLRALHERTAALPLLEFTPPDAARGPLGKDTVHAMQLGVQSAARGLVRYAVDAYAEMYGAYPRVIATGGDARRLFEEEPLVEHIIPDLQLVGLAAVCEAVLTGSGESDDEDEEP